MSALLWAAVAYGVVALLAIRPIAGHLAWSWCFEDREWYEPNKTAPARSDWFMAYLSACLLILCWPLFLPVEAVRYAANRLPKVGAEKRAALIAREQRVREMERDLGIGR